MRYGFFRQRDDASSIRFRNLEIAKEGREKVKCGNKCVFVEEEKRECILRSKFLIRS